MIFSAKNEDGIPLWKLVLSGEKTVTRRKSSKPVGKTYGVFKKPNGVVLGRIKIISCVSDENWIERIRNNVTKALSTRYRREAVYQEVLDKEAEKEGFKTWAGLWRALVDCYTDALPRLYRIEFKLIK